MDYLTSSFFLSYVNFHKNPGRNACILATQTS